MSSTPKPRPLWSRAKCSFVRLLSATGYSSNPRQSFYSEQSLEIAPEDQVFRLIMGYRASQAVGLAVELAIPDRVAERCKTAAQFAHATGSDEGSLHRFLRGPCALGVLTEDEQGHFGPTPLSTRLRSGQREHALARMTLSEGYAAWAELGHSVQTGKPAYELVHGLPRWEHMAGNPDAIERFNAAMAASAQVDGKALSDACDLSEISTSVDIGGGRGALMAAVLTAPPKMRGVIVDLEAGPEAARAQLGPAGVGERRELVVGNFFDSVPRGGNAYLLRWILHDWADNDAARIIAVCAEATPPNGRLLVIERLMPERFRATSDDLRLVMADLHMMVVLGGRERTEAEFRILFAAAGLKLIRKAPLLTGTWVLESVKSSTKPI